MSSSSLGKITGRVFMGVDSPGPAMSTIQEIEGKRKPVWDDETTNELIERVKKKAQAMAREIIEQAQAEADMLREKAHGEGFEQGLAEARAQVEQEQTALAEAVGQALGAVASQARIVWAAQRSDFLALIRLAVEKTMAVEMATRRSEILEQLLDESLEAIDSLRGLTIRAKPEEAELVQAILAHVGDRFPELRGYRVKPDESLTLGGLIIESSEGMVDNSIVTRFAEVAKIFERLEQSDPGHGPAFPDGTPESGAAAKDG